MAKKKSKRPVRIVDADVQIEHNKFLNAYRLIYEYEHEDHKDINMVSYQRSHYNVITTYDTVEEAKEAIPAFVDDLNIDHTENVWVKVEEDEEEAESKKDSTEQTKA